MMFDKDFSAGYLANHMARLFAIGLQRRIAPLNLAPAQFMTLLELWEDDGLTQAELVGRLDVEQATMANTLKRMARDGLIERKPHPKDGRAQQNWLTERARSLQEPATKAASAVNEAALAGLTQWERTALIELMRNTIANLQKTQRPS
ncbi:MarR family transcriptional regulator [Notoacmeibacter marinus]|uniref:MarR family transcriptional regulator n=1 Tax=Notoacmeibacter marinus TaxID=1876515 RepID=A0A231V4A5_9HYPH|nr:MarR family transcriptional regulator [Notoacmeibacter marinus]OXT02406.1 MarR family transcriptional regulator [Notoacmeibacter marinus]